MLRALAAPQAGDTIIAQATAPQAAAIAIVRLSGSAAFAIGERLTALPLPQPYRLARRLLLDAAGQALDDALVVAMPRPSSYTGEDLLELHLHGSQAVVAAVLAAGQGLGARAALPGEFTRRAVFNGRLSLPAAEGVGALIHAETEGERQAALALLQGGLSDALMPLYNDLEGLVAGLRASLDFPADVGEEEGQAALSASLVALMAHLAPLQAEAERPKVARTRVALCGPPNAGKSSLLNALLGQERALVDREPGTTRDAVAAPWQAHGIGIELLDTAGIRPEAAGVEARGIVQGQALGAQAAVRLWLLGSPPSWPQEQGHGGGPLWCFGSLADRFGPPERQRIEAEAQRRGLPVRGWLSVQTEEGLVALKQALAAAIGGGDSAATQAARAPFLQRHALGLRRANEALRAAQAALTDQAPADIVLLELEAGLSALAQVLGRDVDAELLDRVFADFCIGK